MTCPIQHNKKHSVQLSLIFIQGVLQNMRNEHGISLTLSIQGSGKHDRWTRCPTKHDNYTGCPKIHPRIHNCILNKTNNVLRALDNVPFKTH